MILRAKLYQPPPRKNLISRPHLAQTLQAALEHPLTLVTAPAGFGKTTAVTHWLSTAQESLDTAWLSLDEGDNDLGRFWRYTFAALHKINEQWIPTAAAALLTDSKTTSAEAIATALINNFFETPPAQPLLLILAPCHSRQPESTP